MLEWFAENIGSIIAVIVLAGLVSAIVFKMIKDKKSGKSSCGCGCEHCAMKDSCHSDKTASN